MKNTKKLQIFFENVQKFFENLQFFLENFYTKNI